MKLILILTFFSISVFSFESHANEIQNNKTKETSRCIPDPKNPQIKCSKAVRAKTSTPIKTIKLKPNEYSLSYTDKDTKIFSTRKYEGLLLSESCFKKNTPNCQAYSKSLKKIDAKPEDHMKSPFHNNFGSIHCQLIGGKSLIAKTPSGNEDDFCLFDDGSMVASWTAYYKAHPQNQSPASKK